ncbi:MAG: response regulator, partial [Planctomycetes bacterium]|nr:response regulator [Planctomycetota bacterium]
RLLDFACPSSGNWTRGDLPTVVRGALDMMRHEMQSSGVEIVEDLRPVPPTPMDEHMIGQVVLNLLINALHAMTDRENKRLELSCGEESGKLFFRVADNGCGMDEETQKQIFTPFFSRKGEHSLTESPMRKLRGSGLGLSICYTIVKKHDGQIECKSEPEKGTVFTVRISLRKATDCELPECHSAELAPAASGFGRMLILDDEQDICDLIQSVFVGDGMEVESLADGHQALQRCAEKMIDIVLLDLQMPAMDGVTFLNRLRKLPGIAQPKVIVMSGKTRTLNAFETEAYNVACVLEKPFAINALRKAVLSCLS